MLSTSASTSERWAGLRRAWSWLHPHLLSAGERDSGCWPDLSVRGIGGRRSLLDEMESLVNASAADPSSLAEREQQAARDLIERERAELTQPVGCSELADLLSAALLQPLRSGDHERLTQAIETLPSFLNSLGGRPLREERAGAAEDLATRLDSLSMHVERRALEADIRLNADALGALRDLATQVDITAFTAPDPRQFSAGLQAKDLQTLDAAIARNGAELERRAASLAQRYLGEQAGQDNLARLVDLIHLDHARPEHWSWILRQHCAEMSAELALRGLPSHRDECPLEVEPGLAPGVEELCPASWLRPWTASGWRLADLSLLDPLRLEAHLREYNHVRLPLLVATQLLPGRAWLLESFRQQDHPASLLLRSSDLDLWASWSPGWLLRLGWLSGERRVRLLQLQERHRTLLAGKVDLLRLLAVRPDEELSKPFVEDSQLPAHLAAARWKQLQATPGRATRLALDSLALQDLARDLKRRWSACGGGLDLLGAMQRAVLLPREDWPLLAREHEPRGLFLRKLPAPLAQPREDRDGLLSEIEERLAALGRIRREDLLAGAEFDQQSAEGMPTACGDLAESAELSGPDSPEPAGTVPESSLSHGSAALNEPGEGASDSPVV